MHMQAAMQTDSRRGLASDIGQSHASAEQLQQQRLRLRRRQPPRDEAPSSGCKALLTVGGLSVASHQCHSRWLHRLDIHDTSDRRMAVHSEIGADGCSDEWLMLYQMTIPRDCI